MSFSNIVAIFRTTYESINSILNLKKLNRIKKSTKYLQ